MRVAPAIAMAAGLFGGLAACAGTGMAQSVPAVLVAPDEADIAEVARAAENLSGVSQVTLSGEVLTDSPELLLDRQMSRSIDSNAAGGFIMERPPRFTLMKKGRQCLLVHDGTGESEPLAGVECTPFTER